MTYTFENFNYWVRLDKGEKLSESLAAFMHEAKIEGAWVSGIGAALSCELRFYNLEHKEYQWRVFEGLREVLSLQGNLAKNEAGEMMFHLHGTFGDEQFNTIGGHVKELVVGATLELYVHRSHLPLARKMDSHVGLQTLDL